MTRSQLIFQRHGTLLLTPGDGRDELVALARQCAQLRAVVAGNYVYDVAPIALWGAAARGICAASLLSRLDAVATTPLPARLAAQIAESIGRYGALRLVERAGQPILEAADPTVLRQLDDEWTARIDDATIALKQSEVGAAKLAAARAGWPVVDARVTWRGNRLRIALREHVALRDYQHEAVDAFVRGGNGLVLLPCGAGKTVVGVAAAAQTGLATLVLTPSRSVAEQWLAAFLALTTVDERRVRLAQTGDAPAPVTIATYHGATGGALAGALIDYPWGLVIYDEAQSLPADTFRLAAAFQSSRRLGLTATLVREDGREREIAALIGPALYDVPWVELEQQGWIAPATCVEVRVPATDSPAQAERYKLAVLERLLARHATEPTLVVGTDLASLSRAARRLTLPLLTGRSPRDARAMTLEAFRAGDITQLALSRIGSVGIDLPSAQVLVQLSGTFGSRQEEAQRLGRLLRPAPGKRAHFYTLVSNGTPQERYAAKRQRFLVEQGYQYEVLDAAEIPRSR
jgi:DNA excision repair protein ERCC-3